MSNLPCMKKQAYVYIGWLILRGKTIVVYDLEHEAIPALYHFVDSVPVGIYWDFEIDFSSMDLV